MKLWGRKVLHTTHTYTFPCVNTHTNSLLSSLLTAPKCDVRSYCCFHVGGWAGRRLPPVHGEPCIVAARTLSREFATCWIFLGAVRPPQPRVSLLFFHSIIFFFFIYSIDIFFFNLSKIGKINYRNLTDRETRENNFRKFILCI